MAAQSVHRNHRLSGPQHPFDGAVDMPEPRIAVGMVRVTRRVTPP
jgi:hypothetical protein